MQQYKFRGKRIPDNKWIYGSLLQWPDGECEIAELDDHKEGNKFMVNPDTVGMCTGLKDRSGVEIWEGDLYNTDVGPSIDRYKIIFISGAFVGGKDGKVCSPLGWQPDNNGDDLVLDKTERWLTVVGNVHDNPELITPADKTATI